MEKNRLSKKPIRDNRFYVSNSHSKLKFYFLFSSVSIYVELDKVYEFFYEKFRSNSKSFFRRNKLSASNDSFSTNLRSFQKSLLSTISCGWTIFLFFFDVSFAERERKRKGGEGEKIRGGK